MLPSYVHHEVSGAPDGPMLLPDLPVARQIAVLASHCSCVICPRPHDPLYDMPPRYDPLQPGDSSLPRHPLAALSVHVRATADLGSVCHPHTMLSALDTIRHPQISRVRSPPCGVVVHALPPCRCCSSCTVSWPLMPNQLRSTLCYSGATPSSPAVCTSPCPSRP